MMNAVNTNAYLQNLGASLTGNIPKMVIFVRDASKVGKDNSAAGGVAGAVAGAVGLGGGIDASANKLMKNLLSASSGAAALTFGAMAKTLGTSGDDEDSQGDGVDSTILALANQMGFLALEVRYNPSSIYIDTQAGTQVNYSGGGLGSASNNQLMQIQQPASSTMSFQLIFDAVSVNDAFMFKSDSWKSDMIGKALNTWGKMYYGQENYSVQDQVEGFVSLLVHDETRQVIVFWSHMGFRGEVTSVNSRYTMFSPSGRPIRGVVDLTIRQGSDEEESDSNGHSTSYDETVWKNAYKKLFDVQMENGALKDIGALSTGQKLMQNNFLNINI